MRLIFHRLHMRTLGIEISNFSEFLFLVLHLKSLKISHSSLVADTPSIILMILFEMHLIVACSIEMDQMVQVRGAMMHLLLHTQKS